MTTRSYLIAHDENAAKTDRIRRIISLQQENVFRTCEWLTDYYLEHGQIPRYLPKGVALADTSMRQKDAYNQVRNAFKTWEVAVKADGRRVIHSLRIEDPDMEKQVYILNKYGLWLHPELVKNAIISEEATDYARLVFEHLIATHPMPVVGTTPTVSFCQANSLAYRASSKATHYDQWITLQSEIPRKPIYIPVVENDYYRNAPGKHNGTVTFKALDNGDVEIRFAKTAPDPIPYDKSGVIALDWGFRTMFATTDGRLLGYRLHDWLMERDNELQELTARLQRLGVPLKSSRRYRRLNHRIAAYVKNEVGRLLNMIADEKWQEIVVEKLDFRGKGFSRRMNRILQRAGRRAVSAKLECLETRGIIITKVNPAYTSQQCSKCGYTDKGNRSGKGFSCRFCGHTVDADVNGARTILARRSCGKAWLYTPRTTILQQLESDFMVRHGIDFSAVKERSSRRRYTATGDGGDKTSGRRSASTRPSRPEL